MADEYIKREDVLKQLKKLAEQYLDSKRMCDLFVCAGIKKVLPVVQSVPAADVREVKKGKWIVLDECSNEGIYCPECHTKIFDFTHKPKKKLSNFCPNCGADMREEIE